MKEKKKHNIVKKWVREEMGFFLGGMIGIGILFLTVMIYLAFSTNGTTLGMSAIRNTAQLEKMLSHTEGRGRLYADEVINTHLQVDLTESEKRNLSFTVGGAYVETPSVSISSYDVTYNIYLAVLENNLLIVLVNARSSIDGLEKIDIWNEQISGKAYFIEELKKADPDFFEGFDNIYVLKGGYPENYTKSYIIILAVGTAVLVFLLLLPSIPLFQRISHVGRNIATLAENEGRTFKEMCKRINKEAENPLYANGSQIITYRYFSYSSSGGVYGGNKINILPVSQIRKISILSGDYEEEMNDIQVAMNDGHYYRLTIHRRREEVEDMVRRLGY